MTLAEGVVEMTLTERTVYRGEWDELGNVRRIAVTEVLRDGEVIAQTRHSRAITPDDDDAGEPQEVRDIVTAVRTPERLARRQAALTEATTRQGGRP